MPTSFEIEITAEGVVGTTEPEPTETPADDTEETG